MSDGSPVISQYMTRSPISVDADASVPIASMMMRLNRFQHLPVVREGNVVGVVCARDLLAFDVLGIPGREDLRVGTFAHTDFYAVSPDARLAGVASEMVKRGVDSALIFEGGGVVGIFTSTDALRAIAMLIPDAGRYD